MLNRKSRFNGEGEERMDQALQSVCMGIIGYCSGSVMYAYLLPITLFHKDVRKYGDGNPGAFNVHLCVSVPMAILCAVLDILKGMIPVVVAFHVLGLRDGLLFLPVMGPVLGHMFPPCLKFRGGKSICTAFGVMIGLMPQKLYALLWACCILLLMPFIRDHTRLILASLGLFVPLCLILEPSLGTNLGMVAVAVMVFIKHCTAAEKTENNS